VAATGTADLYRMQFHLDDKQVQLLDLPAGAPVDPWRVAPGSKWLLVAGDHSLPPRFVAVATGYQYQLARAVPRGPQVGAAVLGGALPNGMVESAHGLSDPEGWGRWSDGRQVRIRLGAALPRHAIVVLTASAYGPNSGALFTLHAGGASTGFTLGPQMRRVELYLETDGTVRELAIDVPQPVSPQALGQSADVRALGLGLARIEVLAEQPGTLSAR
jgi:phosphoglycerol transferase